MKRRRFLHVVGSVGGVGALAHVARRPPSVLDVGVWLSTRAARYDGVADRVREGLELAFTLDHWDLAVDYRGTVDLGIEDAYRVTTGGPWPQAVVAGFLGRGPVEPASDVNLLVTDGQVETAPTGAGLPHVASVGGARHLATFEADGGDSAARRQTTPTRVMQVTIHECGHALGLRHGHGEIRVRDGVTTVTPMVSTYAWSDDYDHLPICGGGEREAGDGERRLSLQFSSCAAARLRAYRGGLTP